MVGRVECLGFGKFCIGSKIAKNGQYLNRENYVFGGAYKLHYHAISIHVDEEERRKKFTVMKL